MGICGVGLDNDEEEANPSSSVTITGANSFSSNNSDGLKVLSRGNVTLENITASNNMARGVYLDNRPSSSGATVTMNGVNNISNNANDGLVINSNDTITLNEIKANSNGTDTYDYGTRLDNDTGNGDVIITGYYNSFSNNAGPGLNISTIGNIELYFAAITGNNTASGSVNGARFTTPGTTSRSVRVYCSTFGNNSGYGLDAFGFENSLTFVGQNSFSGNPSGDYRFNGTAVFEDPDYLCQEPVLGCTDPTAFNYDPAANTDDGSCIPVVLGCADPTAFNYDPEANTDDGSCEPVVLGCTDPSAFNYNSEANTDDGSCVAVVLGCTDSTALNYDSDANTDDGSCIPTILGCTNPNAYNYDSLANVDDGTCRLPRTRDVTTDNIIIPVMGGQFTPISCATPVVSLQLSNGDYVSFGNLCRYDALLDDVIETGLPGLLPDGSQYVSGLNVTLAQDGNTVEPFPAGTNMAVAFKIPSGMEGETFAILRWDGSNWVEESVSVENGYVKATSSNTGTFALVVK